MCGARRPEATGGAQSGVGPGGSWGQGGRGAGVVEPCCGGGVLRLWRSLVVVVDLGFLGGFVVAMVEYDSGEGVRIGLRRVRKLVRKVYGHHDTLESFTVTMKHYEGLL